MLMRVSGVGGIWALVASKAELVLCLSGFVG